MLTGFPFESKRYTEAPNGIPLLRGDNVVQGQLRWDGVKRWPSDSLDGLNQYELQEDDVVLAMDRPWIEAGLKYAAVTKRYLPCLLVQRVARLRGGKNLDTRFLRYLIGSRRFTDYVLGVQTGTAVPHISGGQIKAFEFLRPPLSEQKAIAHILGTLDDKIELNRRMNETLEAMARAIFKSWFVDFDTVRAKAEGRKTGLPKPIADLFPDSFEDSELGEIPQGWRMGPLTEIATLQTTTVHPAERPETLWEHYSIPAFDEGRQPKWERGETIKSGKFAVPQDCVLASKLNPQFPRVWLPDVRDRNVAVCSTEFMPFVPVAIAWRPFLFQLANSEPFQGEILSRVTGSTGSRQRVQPQQIAGVPVVVPPREVIQAFSTRVGPLQERELAGIREAGNLSALRDALLPKLLSGEIRVAHAERIVGRNT